MALRDNSGFDPREVAAIEAEVALRKLARRQHEETMIEVSVAGAVAGAAAGALAGLPGLVTGGIIGAFAGAGAAQVIDDENRMQRMRDDALDHEIGLFGDLGAAPTPRTPRH